jgi:hypothetical protein
MQPHVDHDEPRSLLVAHASALPPCYHVHKLSTLSLPAAFEFVTQLFKTSHDPTPEQET